jgi:hypothetical protein
LEGNLENAEHKFKETNKKPHKLVEVPNQLLRMTMHVAADLKQIGIRGKAEVFHCP